MGCTASHPVHENKDGAAPGAPPRASVATDLSKEKHLREAVRALKSHLNGKTMTWKELKDTSVYKGLQDAICAFNDHGKLLTDLSVEALVVVTPNMKLYKKKESLCNIDSILNTFIERKAAAAAAPVKVAAPIKPVFTHPVVLVKKAAPTDAENILAQMYSEVAIERNWRVPTTPVAPWRPNPNQSPHDEK